MADRKSLVALIREKMPQETVVREEGSQNKSLGIENPNR